MTSRGSALAVGAAVSWPRPEHLLPRERRGNEAVAGVLVFSAMCFNALLCLLDTQLFAVSQIYVIVSEVMIVAASFIYSIVYWNPAMIPMTILLLFSVILWLAESLVNQAVNPLIAGDMVIPPIFMMLGIATASNRLPKFVVYLLGLVFAIAAFEAVAPIKFTRLLNIENFYIGTRHFTGADFYNEESDLFASATRPDERYLLPFLDVHRLSSVFLEPVSLGNYVIIMLIVLLAYRQVVGPGLFWGLLALDGLLLIGSDGRLALGLCAVLVVAAPVIPKLPRWGSLLVLPATIAAVFAIVTALGSTPNLDTFAGRTAKTVAVLFSLDAGNWLGLTSPATLDKLVDSGLAYFIASQSLLGLLILWLVAFGTAPGSRRGLLMHYGAAIYLAGTMAVSYSSFSIKTAALLWYMLGHPRRRDDERGPAWV